jgi:hypothetical protein
MAGGSQSATCRRQVEVGGILYDIAVSGFGDIYCAEWTCSTCHEVGAWAPVSGTPAQAIELARIAIGVHHAMVHQERPTRWNSKR